MDTKQAAFGMSGRVHASSQPGIPAGGRYRVGGRYPGSRVITPVWPSRRVLPPVTLVDRRSPLTVAGAAPAWDLVPRRRSAPASRLSFGTIARPKNLDARRFPASHRTVKRDIKNSLYDLVLPILSVCCSCNGAAEQFCHGAERGGERSIAEDRGKAGHPHADDRQEDELHSRRLASAAIRLLNNMPAEVFADTAASIGICPATGWRCLAQKHGDADRILGPNAKTTATAPDDTSDDHKSPTPDIDIRANSRRYRA